MIDVCIDTDVGSMIQKRRQPSWMDRHLSGNRIWLTFVTVGELARWAAVRAWGPVARQRLDDWIGTRAVVPYDEEVARVWGRLAGVHSCGVGRARRTTPGSPHAAFATSSRCSL